MHPHPIKSPFKMKNTLINLIGAAERNNTGYGIFTRGFKEALDRKSSKYLNFHFTELGNKSSIEQGIIKTNEFPGDVINIHLQVGHGKEILKLFRGNRISYTMFETDKLPDGWAEGLNLSDKVFVPSAWGRQVMINCGVDYRKIFVVPGGVDANIYHPWGESIEEIKNINALKFLTVGKYENRKGYEELFQSFLDAFKNQNDVILFVKANSFSDSSASKKVKMLANSIGLKNIRFIEGEVDEKIMASLYRSFDYFVYPTKGEGWGLPLIEAMACGLPVISTCTSGHSQFLSCLKGDFHEIETITQIADKDELEKYYKFKDGVGNWNSPIVDSLYKCLIEAGNEIKQNRYSKKLELAKKISSHYSWDNSATSALTILIN